MSQPLLPNAELVARAWLLAAVDGINNNVAKTLPDAPWPDNEFIKIAEVGGSPDPENPRYGSVISLECYAERPGSLKPPWGQAQQLAQRVLAAIWTQPNIYAPDPRVDLVLPSGYGRALVQTVTPVSDVRQAPPDPSQYAVYMLDIEITWTPASVVISRG